MTVIYIDVLLAVNGWADFLLLLAVRRFCGAAVRPWRMALGAAFGAATALTLLLPPIPWWAAWGIKLSAAAGMVLITFGTRRFFSRFCLLFGLSAALAGVCSALYFFVAPAGFFVHNGTVYYDVPPLLLVGLTAVGYLILLAVEKLARRRMPEGGAAVLRITVGGKSADVRCCIDTGNHLTDPFTGQPVVVAERAALAAVIAVPRVSEEAALAAGRYRMIPFESIGGGGVLPAFRPERLALVRRGGEIVLPPCFVAVCDRLPRREYQGLIGSALGEYSADGKRERKEAVGI